MYVHSMVGISGIIIKFCLHSTIGIRWIKVVRITHKNADQEMGIHAFNFDLQDLHTSHAYFSSKSFAAARSASSFAAARCA